MDTASDAPDLEIVDGTTFELRPSHRQATQPDWVCLRKNRRLTNRYKSLAEEFRGCRMIEVGVDQGGSTSYFTKLLKPEKLLAFELSADPVPKVMRFLSNHDKDGRVEIHWGVDQSDRSVVPALVERAFGSHPIDIVVDDASHLLAPTTATFEMLFPRLRPDGLYVVEDWCGDHALERALKQAIDKEADGKFQSKLTADVAASKSRVTPTSVLICQFVVAVGRRPDWITELRLMDGYCELRRGPGEIPANTPMSDYTGPLGEWMFEGLAG